MLLASPLLLSLGSCGVIAGGIGVRLMVVARAGGVGVIVAMVMVMMVDTVADDGADASAIGSFDIFRTVLVGLIRSYVDHGGGVV